jgi:hypothetical protein
MNRLMFATILGLNTLAMAVPVRAVERVVGGASTQAVDFECRGGAVKPAIKTEITGKLQYVIRHWHTKELIMICDKLPQTLSRSWSIGYGITVGGKTIDVEFSNHEQRKLADRLCGKQVIICGHDTGDKIAVDRLAAIPTDINATTMVRIRGFLKCYVLETFPGLSVHLVRAEGKTFRLEFANDELRILAENLNGCRVFINGTLNGDLVTVRELKSDDTGAATERIVLQGKLTWHDPRPEQPHFAIEPPIHGVWQLEADGRKFTLSLTRDQRFAAWNMKEKNVRVVGTVENGIVRVSQMQTVEPAIQWTIDLRGVLVYINVAPAIPSLVDNVAQTIRPRIDVEDRFPVVMEWMVTVKDKTYTLRFATPELEKRAKALINKPVIISGDVDGYVVTVRKIEADEASSIDKKVQVEAIGKLTQVLRPSKLLPPEVPNLEPLMWILECDGRVYELNLPAAFEERAAKLCDHMILLRGKRNGEQIDVEDLISVEAPRQHVEAR